MFKWSGVDTGGGGGRQGWMAGEKGFAELDAWGRGLYSNTEREVSRECGAWGKGARINWYSKGSVESGVGGGGPPAARGIRVGKGNGLDGLQVGYKAGAQGGG